MEYRIDGKRVEIFAGKESGSPAIYINTFQGMGAQLRDALEAMGAPDHTLVAISDVDWNRDMAPWAIPAIYPGDTPCTGGADAYLNEMQQDIIPFAERQTGTPAWRGLAGYSLAGLFAIYAMYNTDAFLRFGTMSGSLWFPDLLEYISTHEMRVEPACIYFSLGDKECKTRNKYLCVVQKNTDIIYGQYKEAGIRTVFTLNKGNHYREPIRRTADGLYWMLMH
ncbi:MAG: alpha/beta hydrolase [Clostridia bacterium]|nr:alpha/beta hydrolase [Clostridia bacterium]